MYNIILLYKLIGLVNQNLKIGEYFALKMKKMFVKNL